MNPTAESTGVPASSGRRVILACATGNFVEWFDFTLYGFTAAVIATVFFPPDAGATGLLGAFAVYGVAFLGRPLGAVFFGRLGDRVGRRAALSGSIMLMGVSTAAIGVLPGWAAIGVAAPVLLLVCRLAQGVSAGGEYTGALTFVLEHAPDRRRGLWLSLVGSSTWLGAVGATATVLGFQYLTGDGFATGGWRWPFVIGGAVAIVGLFLRLRVDETPVFTAMAAAEPDREVRPFRELVRGHRRTLVVVFVFFSTVGVLIHMFLGFMPTYLTRAAGVAPSAALLVTTGVTLVIALMTPLFGVLIDRVGRRPLLRAGAVGAVLVVVPAYLVIGTGGLVVIVLALLAMLVVVSLISAGGIAVLEMYPASVRFSGTALPYNLAYAVFAGTAPLVGQLLMQGTGSLLSPAYYATLLALLALPVLWTAIPETRGSNLRTGASTRRLDVRA